MNLIFAYSNHSPWPSILSSVVNSQELSGSTYLVISNLDEPAATTERHMAIKIRIFDVSGGALPEQVEQIRWPITEQPVDEFGPQFLLDGVSSTIETIFAAELRLLPPRLVARCEKILTNNVVALEGCLRELFERLRPKFVFIPNGRLAIQRCIWLTAQQKSIPVRFYEQAFLQDSFEVTEYQLHGLTAPDTGSQMTDGSAE